MLTFLTNGDASLSLVKNYTFAVDRSSLATKIVLILIVTIFFMVIGIVFCFKKEKISKLTEQIKKED